MHKHCHLELWILILFSVLAAARASNITFECPSGWDIIGTHCYNFVNIPMDFEDARDVCDKYGAKLLVIRDEVEANNVSNVASKKLTTSEHFWIYNGKYEQDSGKGSFNSTLCKGLWQPNEPKETDENVGIASNVQGRWALTWVWSNLPFVCRKPACPRGSFQCSDGTCLNSKWKCDKAYDCKDLSDENDCSGLNGIKYFNISTGTVDISNMTTGNFHQWIIEGQPGEVIRIEFDSLTIEDHVDNVRLYSGGPSIMTSDLIQDIKTSQSGKLSVFSKNHFVIVTLQSYTNNSQAVVKFNWIADNEASWKQVNIVNVTAADSSISSPYYNFTVAPVSFKREWLLTVPDGELITLEILDNTLELNASSDFYIVTNVGFVLKELNSNKSIYISSTNSMSIIIKARSLKQKLNFNARLRKGCDFVTNLTLATFTLKNLPANHSCSWTVNNEVATNFSLQISDTSSGISSDVLQIYNSVDRNSTTLVDILNKSTSGIKYFEAMSGVFSFTYIPDTFHPAKEITGNISADCEDVKNSNKIVTSSKTATGEPYKVELSCPKGFRFKQEEYSKNTTLFAVCKEGGKWNWGSPSYTRTPECQIVYCGFPPPIPNGIVSSIYENITYNSVASYQCFSGFGIVGDSNVTCQADGTWSVPPHCVADNCSEILNVTHGSTGNSSDVSEGSVVTFSCDPGYSLQGAKTIACLSNKTWSHLQPQCKELTCPLPVIEHGHYEPKSIPKFGESVSLVCDNGYKINRTQTQSDTSISCNINRTLSVENDTCIDVDECINSSANNCSYTENCVNLVGSYTCVCKSGFNGTDCKDVDECALGVCHQKCTNLDSSYSCSCYQGYLLYTENGTNGFYIPVGEDGLKPGDVYQINNTCVPVTCDTDLQPPENGTVLKTRSTYYYNESVDVVCSFGYTLENPSVATCQSDGNWTYTGNTVPKCKKMTCPQPTLGLHEASRVTATGEIEPGANLTITCNLDDGSGNVTHKILFCALNASGQFSLQGDDPTCPEVNCGKPLDIPGGNPLNVTNTTYGSSFEFSCDSNRGFFTTGASTLGNTTVVCQSNGHWGFANLTCEGSRCQDPGTLGGTVQIVKTSYEIDQIVQYNCTRPGYTTLTNNTLVCEYKNGNADWSGKPPTCEDTEPPEITCPTVDPLDLYSTLVYQDPHVSDNSGFSCLIESGPPSGVSVVSSNTTVRFKATDSKNYAACEFNVTVKDRTQPTIQCPPVIQKDLAGSRNELFNLTEDLLSNSGDGTIMFDPSGPLNLTLGSVFPVRVNITKENGLVKGCAFLVRAVSTNCSNETLPSLDNGRIENCAGNGNKMTCVGVCDDGYLFQNASNSSSYSCVNGAWDVDFHVQSCIKMNDLIYSYDVTLLFSHSGRPSLTQYDASFCSSRQCSLLLQHVKNISTCGYDNFTAINCRSIASGRASEKTSFTLQLLTSDGNETSLRDCVNTLKNQSETLFGPTLPVPVIGNMTCMSPWSVNSNAVVMDPRNFSCSINSIMVNYNRKKSCLPCGFGTFFNSTTGTCEQCQDGFYQDENAQEVCKPCPLGVLKSHAPRTKKNHCFELCPEGFTSTSGYIEENCTACPENYFSNSSNSSCQPCPNNGSTLGISGATSVTQCSEPCSPGEYSITGFKPCSVCPKNFYSDIQGVNICSECPSNTTTEKNGSNSLSDCINGSSLCTDDFCNPNGTKNNSVCEIINHRPVCKCEPGFYGDACYRSCDVCKPNPCYNDGICTASGLNFTCACKNESKCTFNRNQHIVFTTNTSIVWMPLVGNVTCHDLCLNDSDCLAYLTNSTDPSVCILYYTLLVDNNNNPFESFEKNCSEHQLFEGLLCEKDLINDCTDDVCTNIDFCRDLIHGTKCQCPHDGGTYNNKCAKTDNLCQTKNCSLGKCVSSGSLRAVCECDPGYTGDRCETEINECDINKHGCLYNGSCQDGVNTYSCSCVNGFTGSHCEVMADFCSHNDCKVANGGKCTNDYQNLTAICTCGEHYKPDSLYPDTCVPINYCLNNPCENNGTCIGGIGGFRCVCLKEFTGSHCQHNIDDCVSHTCKNGATCVDGVSSYTCTCPAGFTGSFCEENINDCPGKCVGNNIEAACQDLVEDYYCPCKPAYTGKNCSEDVNMCTAYEPCLHGGNCSDFTGGYNCTCAAGWKGVNCEDEINYCSSYPCQNGGSCYSLVDQYFCKCLDGTSGNNCQQIEKLCDKFNDSACSSNGKCEPDGATIGCLCLEEYSGVACELEKDYCADDPCNGGICTQNQLTYVCDCSNVKGNNSGNNCNETKLACSTCPNRTKCHEFEDQDGYRKLACMCLANETLFGSTCKTVNKNYDLAFLESFANKGTVLTSESGFYLDKNSSLSVSLWVAAAKPIHKDQFLLALRSSETNSSFLSVFNTRLEFSNIVPNYVNLTDDIGRSHSLDEFFNWHFLSIAWSTNGSLEIMFDFIQLNQTRLSAPPPSEKFVFVQLGQSFYGYISQVSVWKTSLTSDEQREIYRDKLAVPQPDSLLLGWTQYSFDSSVKRTKSSTAAGSFSICNITDTIAQIKPNSPDCKNRKFTDKTPPEVNYCNESKVLPVDYSKHQVNSSELGYEFTDDTEINFLSEDQLFSYGAYDIAVSAVDSAGNIGVCMTRAYITPNKCSDTEPSQGFVAKCSDNKDGNKVTCPPGMLPSVPTANVISCSNLLTYNLDNLYEKPDRIVCGTIKPLSVTVNMLLPYQIVVTCDDHVISSINDHIVAVIKTLNTTWKGVCSDNNCSNVNTSGNCTGSRSLVAYVQISGLNAHLSSPIHPPMTLLEIMKMSVAGKDTFNFSLVANAYVENKNVKIEEISSCDKGHSTSGIYCVQCGSGSYYDQRDMKCKLCELNTYSDYPGSTSCTPCLLDTVTLQRGSSNSTDCKDKCPAGQMLNLTTDTCVACPLNFYQDQAGKSYCFPCPPATGTKNNGSTSQTNCTDICKPGTELKGQVCVECQRGFYRPGTIQDACSLCPLSNYTTRGNGSISEDECNIPRCSPGYFVQGNDSFTCQLCDYGTYQPNEAEFECISCGMNLTTENTGETNNSMCRFYCPEGEEGINDTCVSCSDNHYKKKSGFGQCMNCTGDFTSTPSNRSYCTELFCDVGRELIAGNCSKCTVGHYKPSRGNDSCIECPVNTTTVSEGSTSDLDCVLVVCPAGSYRNESNNNCSLCELGTYQDLPGKNNCTSCGPNYTTQFEGSIASSQCYETCPQGTYRNGTNDCIPCPLGQYQNESDQTSCKMCGNIPGYNVSTVSTQTINEWDCFPTCPEGFYFDKGGRFCLPCPVGSFQSTENLDTECTPCKANFTTLYKNETSADACILDKCVKGYYRDVNSTECKPCPVGEYQDSDVLLNVTACAKCDNGTTTLFEGAPTRGGYCIQNCSKGEEYHIAFKNCSACPIGMYRPEGVREPPTCLLCEPGSTTLKTSESKCIQNPESTLPTVKIDLSLQVTLSVQHCSNPQAVFNGTKKVISQIITNQNTRYDGICPNNCTSHLQIEIDSLCGQSFRSKRQTSGNATVNVLVKQIDAVVKRKDGKLRPSMAALMEAFYDLDPVEDLLATYLLSVDSVKGTECGQQCVVGNFHYPQICFPGHFVGVDNCEPCGKGSYSTDPVSHKCESCPDGQTTTMDGAGNNSSSCDGICATNKTYCGDKGNCRKHSNNKSYCDCHSYYYGYSCSQRKEPEDSNIKIVVGVTVGLGVFLLILLIICGVIAYRRRADRKSTTTSVESESVVTRFKFPVFNPSTNWFEPLYRGETIDLGFNNPSVYFKNARSNIPAIEPRMELGTDKHSNSSFNDWD